MAAKQQTEVSLGLDISKKYSYNSGHIRVGTRIYGKGGHTDPSYPGFKKILCLTPSTPYGDLGPYVLADEQGRNMENRWQFSKVYVEVPPTVQRYSRFDQTVIWSQKEQETHIVSHPTVANWPDGTPVNMRLSDDRHLTPEYFHWRYRGMYNSYPVRYPVGRSYRSKCIGSIKDEDLGKSNRLLTYVEARKEIYLPIYVDLVQKRPKFHKLKEMLARGENLLIIEVDGPHQESLSYYQEKYGVEDDFIEKSTILATERNLNIMLNDEKHAFGHGYCLAYALSSQS